ncbi:hypothetical protein TanjilG_06913 [Lupinus angustifolius]|uniref:Cation efflux protein transmembrane domain-containing protein n=1 Tax=Lupinus angustifolius TaxID=3871 RepID=A0A4P1QVG8_LUPAN|nr:hypothetical protein TanjilG_06913 [Lupinus angustifolius]
MEPLIDSNNTRSSSNDSDLGFRSPISDRRFAFSRQASFQQQREQQPQTPISIDGSRRSFLTRSDSSIDIPTNRGSHQHHYWSSHDDEKHSVSVQRSSFVLSVFWNVWSGHRYMKRLFILISLNVAYSTSELLIGLFTGRVGLVSDAFHLTFGCGLLTFSLFVMAASRKKPGRGYTYGYKRLEVLSAFTNAQLKHFMPSYKMNQSTTYRNAEDMNHHSVFLHVLADSIRRVQNAEVLCSGLVSGAVFMLVLPLFRAAGGILLQMAPPSIPTTALSKCLRQITALEDVVDVSQARFWELVPGHVVGSLSIQVKKGVDDRQILGFVHGLYHDLGVQDLTVQIDAA